MVTAPYLLLIILELRMGGEIESPCLNLNQSFFLPSYNLLKNFKTRCVLTILCLYYLDVYVVTFFGHVIRVITVYIFGFVNPLRYLYKVIFLLLTFNKLLMNIIFKIKSRIQISDLFIVFQYYHHIINHTK